MDRCHLVLGFDRHASPAIDRVHHPGKQKSCKLLTKRFRFLCISEARQKCTQPILAIIRCLCEALFQQPCDHIAKHRIFARFGNALQEHPLDLCAILLQNRRKRLHERRQMCCEQ